MNPNEYKQLFRGKGKFACLHTEFFLEGSLALGKPLVLFDDGTWHSFIHEESEKICLDRGKNIFTSTKRYQEYSKTFRNYISYVRQTIMPKYMAISWKITRQELEEICITLAQFWYYYGITEFSYHDLAYEHFEKTQDEELGNNLDDLGELKFEGRKILNAFLFDDGVVMNILEHLSKRFYKDEDSCLYMYKKELLALFENELIAKEKINQRRRAYGGKSVKGKFVEIHDAEVHRLIQIFTKIDSKDELRGTATHPGTATGRAVVAPIFFNRKKVREMFDKMREGDILIVQTTSPELAALCKLASAIVTDQGGMLSHAAIISRELKKPCIIGTQDATRIFKDGDVVEVDADSGIVRKLTK